MLNFYPDENFYKNIWQQQILILILQTIEKYNYHAKDVPYKNKRHETDYYFNHPALPNRRHRLCPRGYNTRLSDDGQMEIHLPATQRKRHGIHIHIHRQRRNTYFLF